MATQEIPLVGYQPKLLNRVEVAEGTMAFHFEKPPGFDFISGQSADLTLLNPPETDSEGNVRTFSIAIRQADHDRAPHKLYLFYSNRRPEDALFLEVLQNLEKTNPNFCFIATMTDMPRSKKTWNGETARINREMLSKYLNDLQGPIYYIAGPPAMVSGMRKMLVASDVDEDDIRTDEFSGY